MGVQSVVWRRRWEETGSATLKDRLTTYNLEDCAALQRVTECLYAICPREDTTAGATSSDEHAVLRVEEMTHRSRMHGWNERVYADPDFAYINDRASFDYQRDWIYFRTSNAFKSKGIRRRTKKWKRNRRVNREVEISSMSCPSCGGVELARRPNRSLARLAFDLRITRSGIRGWVTHYRTAWHQCVGCGNQFLSGDYLRLQEFCHPP